MSEKSREWKEAFDKKEQNDVSILLAGCRIQSQKFTQCMGIEKQGISCHNLVYLQDAHIQLKRRNSSNLYTIRSHKVYPYKNVPNVDRVRGLQPLSALSLVSGIGSALLRVLSLSLPAFGRHRDWLWISSGLRGEKE